MCPLLFAFLFIHYVSTFNCYAFLSTYTCLVYLFCLSLVSLYANDDDTCTCMCIENKSQLTCVHGQSNVSLACLIFIPYFDNTSEM